MITPYTSICIVEVLHVIDLFAHVQHNSNNTNDQAITPYKYAQSIYIYVNMRMHGLYIFVWSDGHTNIHNPSKYYTWTHH